MYCSFTIDLNLSFGRLGVVLMMLQLNQPSLTVAVELSSQSAKLTAMRFPDIVRGHKCLLLGVSHLNTGDSDLLRKFVHALASRTA